jgi:arylsulfatase A
LMLSHGVSAQELSANRATKPNIIVIMADDLGYGDTSAYGGWVKTPQLERMAAEGMTFRDFHANSSVCSPTRAAFMTGRYQQRVGIVDVIVGRRDTHGLSPDELTIPSLLKQDGYQTALFGKWHLGEPAEFNPLHHGFDEFVGYLIGAADYHNHRGSWHDGLQKKDQHGYTTHLITNFSTRFIEENKSRPFFLLVAHEAVHLPFQTPADTVENRVPVPKKEQWSRTRIRPKYKIMLEEMDKGIGTILDTVNRCGIAENTFVFFFSDNGAIGAGSNQPLRGGKFSHYEGGHRVPAIAWWPGKIAAGAVNEELTMGTDLLPTIADLADIPIPKDRELDGTSMKELLLHQSDFPDRQLFFGYEPKLGTAMRDQHWKMIVSSRGVELYNLENDIGETKNLVDMHPERATQMKEAIEEWKNGVGSRSSRAVPQSGR